MYNHALPPLIMSIELLTDWAETCQTQLSQYRAEAHQSMVGKFKICFSLAVAASCIPIIHSHKLSTICRYSDYYLNLSTGQSQR